jgi:hypothetical protein
MAKKTKTERETDARINRAFKATCCNIQIPIMDLPKVWKAGEALITAGADDAALAAGLRKYVDILTGAA